ncbi:hypothetical protein TNCV_3287201 [Trichonephila clavipes]|nr:hypothetical protein TNCV_3287201 [Trichonephila clavipes]
MYQAKDETKSTFNTFRSNHGNHETNVMCDLFSSIFITSPQNPNSDLTSIPPSCQRSLVILHANQQPLTFVFHPVFFQFISVLTSLQFHRHKVALRNVTAILHETWSRQTVKGYLILESKFNPSLKTA